MTCSMADGTHMQGPQADTAADTEIMFPEGTKKRWYGVNGQRFQIQKSDSGPCIIGNDFWSRHRAMFDFNSRSILLLRKSGKVKDRIPFTCSRPGPNCAAAVVDQGEGGKPHPMLVRATRDMLLQPREGCVIGPTLESPIGSLHHTSQMILDPVLSNTKVVLDTDRSRGYSKLKLFCTPTAAVIPQYVPAENRYGVATTVINMGSDPLVIRQGDIIAEARLCGDIEALHDASREEQAF